MLSDEKEAEAEEGAELDIEQELAADLEKERNYKKETPRHFRKCTVLELRLPVDTDSVMSDGSHV